MWRLDKSICLKLMLLGLVVLPVLGSGGVGSRGSLRGALQALERRRRAPSGPYPLANFQIPERTLEYLSSNHQGYPADGPPMLMDDHRQPSEKAAMVEYLDKNDDFSPEDLELNYKATSFRNQNADMNDHHNHINEKKRSSSFRERQVKRSYQSDRLKELFLKELSEQEDETDEQQRRNQLRYKSDTENAELLKELWGKYKSEFPEDVTRRNIRKRQIPGDYTPTGWGPIAFKRKRSSNQRIDDGDSPNDFLYSLKFVSQSDPSVVENLKDEKINDEEDDMDVSKIMYNRYQDQRYPAFELPPQKSADLRDEYMMALQPLNNPQSNEDIPEEEDYIYEKTKEKRFPVSKRSSPYSSSSLMYHQGMVKRNFQTDKKKLYLSSGTDPRVIKELSNIFGGKDLENQAEGLIQKPVKRSSVADDDSHESKSPAVSAHSHDLNETYGDHSKHSEEGNQRVSESDHSHHDSDHPHSRHEHDSKPPLLSSSNGHDHSHENEENKEVSFDDNEDTHIKIEHPIILKKKSIDWSNYFGIDKRKKKSLNNHADMKTLKESYLNNAKRYMNSYSLNNLRLYGHPGKLNEQSNIFSDVENGVVEKRNPKQIEQIKLDSMDNKLKNMESVIVDEALLYSGTNDGLDTKEEQEIKEKILSRLAAAYSLEKMRKALKEFKASLQAQRYAMKDQLPLDYEEDKEKRMSVKYKLNKMQAGLNSPEELKHAMENSGIDQINDQDFENEQGAGHFLNGPVESMSEGYMGGSGMKNSPDHLQGPEGGVCPILDRIVRRCHSVDILAGDHGQLFLPLCSLHQICYLCGPSSPTGCDLIFLSEADSMCGGREACQKAARATVMSLRDIHDTMADDLEGECAQGNCLSQAIETNTGWQQALKR